MDRSNVSAGKFIRQFLRSFGKALLLYLILFSILFIGPWIIAGSHEIGEWPTPEHSELLTAFIPLLFGMCYCYGWAGSMHRGNVIRVGATGAVGALNPPYELCSNTTTAVSPYTRRSSCRQPSGSGISVWALSSSTATAPAPTQPPCAADASARTPRPLP